MKSDLAHEVKLSHIQANHELCLAMNDSAIGIGEVLQQKCDSKWRPIFFFSRKLLETETWYSTFGGELVATFSAMRYFCQCLEG